MGPKSGRRSRWFRAVHAEALKRGMDHDALHDLCTSCYKVHSMSELTEEQLESIYHGWTGKSLRRHGSLPRRGEAAAGAVAQIVSAEDLELLAQEAAKRGWGADTLQKFVRRQLQGRDTIRTRRDWARVYNGLRAMNRREAVCESAS